MFASAMIGSQFSDSTQPVFHSQRPRCHTTGLTVVITCNQREFRGVGISDLKVWDGLDWLPR